MERLPTLIKKPNKKYFVGCDVTHERGTEIFAFSVLEVQDDKSKLFVQSERVVSRYETETDKKYLQWIQTLKEFYNSVPIVEINQFK